MSPIPPSQVSYLWEQSNHLPLLSRHSSSGISAGQKRLDAHELEGVDMEKEGLGVVMAAVFLAGEMAGSGVLAMPAAMIGTGHKMTTE